MCGGHDTAGWKFVYTTQPVVKPVVKWVNRNDNRLYRVYKQLTGWKSIQHCVESLSTCLHHNTTSATFQQKPDLFKDTGTVDAVTNAVDQFQKAHAERPQSSVIHLRWVVKIKVDEDCLS